MLQEITTTSACDDTLLAQCEHLLKQHKSNPDGIRTYLEPLKKSP